jgi:aryl-alcohol dehydrogenase-like predicted oxidoreductase
LGQAALKFILASPEVASTLPNIYDEQQLREFAAAPETPDFTEEELVHVEELYENNFGLEKQSALSTEKS